MIIISLPQQINRLSKGRKKENVGGRRMKKGGEEREIRKRERQRTRTLLQTVT